MADKKLLRKIAPIIMSAAVAMTSSPEKPQKRSLDLRTAKPETQKMLF